MKSKIFLITTIAVIITLSFLTIGFASYSQLLNLNGSVSVKPQGKMEITNITLQSSQNTSSVAEPTYEDLSASFNITFRRAGGNARYNAVYNITLTNNTFYKHVIKADDFNLNLSSSNGGTVTPTVSGIEEGEVIEPGNTKTFTLTITFTPRNGGGNTFVVSGDVEVVTEEQAETGNVIGSIETTSILDLVNNTIVPVEISVINTYNSSKTFSISSASNKFQITDRNGNALSSQIINANTTRNYTVYLKRLEDAFASSPQTTSLNITTQEQGTTSIGTVRANVPVDSTITDNAAPVISNVNATQTNTKGTVRVSWTGTDDNSITNYTILYYKVVNGNRTLVDTINTTSNSTSIDIENVDDGTYVFKVYGTDEFGNKPTQNEIDNASTNSGTCSISEQLIFKWNCSITYNLSNLTSTNTDSTIDVNKKFTTTLEPATATFMYTYSLPTSITVTMNGNTLTQGTDYTYDSTSGEIEIPNTTGDIVISATAQSNRCLIEGTQIRLANGSTKSIENITYSDLLQVWNYKTGSIGYSYPIWIEKTHYTDIYTEYVFSDGNKLNVSGSHGVFNTDTNTFVKIEDLKIGDHIAKVDNKGKLHKVALTKKRQVIKKVKYYHVVSTYFYDIIANNYITTDDEVSLTNIYKFNSNIKWLNYTTENRYTYNDFKDILPYSMYKGLRVEDAAKLPIDIDMFKYYLMKNQLNEEMYKLPIMDKKGNILWPVSIDNKKELYKDGSYYKLPNNSKVKYYIESNTKKKYNKNEKTKVNHGTHFISVKK